MLAMVYHIHIWQVLLQLSCNDTCQYECDANNLTGTLTGSKILLTEKLTNGSLVIPCLDQCIPFCYQLQHCLQIIWNQHYRKSYNKMLVQINSFSHLTYCISLWDFMAYVIEIALDIFCWPVLTHWGRVMHICIVKITIIGSDNGLSPERHQAIIWTNAGILLIGPLGTNFSDIVIEIKTFSLKKMSSAKCVHFVWGLNVLKGWGCRWSILEEMSTGSHTRWFVVTIK